MAFELGLYEQLINKIIANKLQAIDQDAFFIQSTKLDKAEASRYLSLYLSETIQFALNGFKDDDNRPLKQIELSNRIIQLLIEELPALSLSDNLIDNEGKLLQAIFSKLDSPYADLGARVKQITPYTRLSQSELFTGSNVGISLESELKKEILSADEICWLVSFIKYSGIRIFKDELEEFTNSGKRLRIITTSYMGATDLKAVEFLASLKNTEIKVSYNADHERLHAKAYLFLRNTGFNTGYIGSSNISRSALTNGLEWNLKVTTREIGHIIEKIDFVEKDISLFDGFPLKIHSRYTRDEILVAMKLHTFEKASSNREGVALNKYLNTEAFFVTLKKSEKEYSPTTLYDDYALSEYLFHWQSQNTTAPESPKGLSYIRHQELEKKILIFVREQNEDEYGFTMSYVFLGLADFQKTSGAKPMNIEWKLKEPMPAYIWKESGKLAVG